MSRQPPLKGPGIYHIPTSTQKACNIIPFWASFRGFWAILLHTVGVQVLTRTLWQKLQAACKAEGLRSFEAISSTAAKPMLCRVPSNLASPSKCREQHVRLKGIAPSKNRQEAELPRFQGQRWLELPLAGPRPQAASAQLFGQLASCPGEASDSPR